MGKGLDRTEILRRDCPACHGNGYQTSGSGEMACDECGGIGMLEVEVPFKFDGPRTLSEKAAAFGIPVEEYKDAGHDNGRGFGASNAAPADDEI